MGEWRYVTDVASDSEPGVQHRIERRRDGAYRCDCMSYRFARGAVGTPGKSCRHLDAYRDGHADDVAARAYHAAYDRGHGRVVTRPSVPTRKNPRPTPTETFTFVVRGISFGGIE